MNIQKYKSCREYRDAIRTLYKKDLDYEGYMTCLDFQSAIQKEKSNILTVIFGHAVWG